MVILFTHLDRQAVVRTKQGVYKQVKLARRDIYLYAAVSGGYVQLYANHVTSHPGVTWVELEGDYTVGQFGRLLA